MSARDWRWRHRKRWEKLSPPTNKMQVIWSHQKGSWPRSQDAWFLELDSFDSHLWLILRPLICWAVFVCLIYQEHLWLNSRQVPWPYAWSQASTASEIDVDLLVCRRLQAVASDCKWLQQTASVLRYTQVYQSSGYGSMSSNTLRRTCLYLRDWPGLGDLNNRSATSCFSSGPELQICARNNCRFKPWVTSTLGASFGQYRTELKPC